MKYLVWGFYSLFLLVSLQGHAVAAKFIEVPYSLNPRIAQTVKNLEERISAVDSNYHPFTHKIPLENIGLGSFVFFDFKGRAIAAVIEVTEPRNQYVIDTLILLDPSSENTETKSKRLRYELLNTVFLATDFLHVDREAQIRFSVAAGDFFSLGYLQELFRLRGFVVDLEPRSSNNKQVRSILAKEQNLANYQRVLPLFDVVESVGDRLVESALQQELKSSGSQGRNLHYEVVVSSEAQPLSLCRSLF